MMHFNCLNCGSVKIKGRNSLNKYCDNKCQHDFQFKIYIEKWLTHDDPALYTFLSEHVRRYIFAKYDNKCCLCGWCQVNPSTNKTPLEIDHIDGNSENNKEDNLRLICPNCHSLTPNYKALNKGNGRHFRRKRYLEGKSY